MKKLAGMTAGLLLMSTAPAGAEALVQAKLLSLDMARTIAGSAIEACRKDGYQVSVVVTDRSGEPLVIMRDVYSNRYFTQLAHGKTQAVLMANTTSAELRKNRADMVNELRGALRLNDSELDKTAGPWCRYCALLSTCREGAAAVKLADS